MALVLSLSQAVRPNLAPATLKPWRAPPGLPGHRSIGRRDGESRDVSSYPRCVAACLGVAVATSRRRRIARSAGAVEPDDSQEFEDYDDEEEESIPRGEYDEDLGMAEEMDPEEMEQIMRALQGGEGSRVSETGDLMGDGTLLKSIIQEAPRMAMRPQLGDEVSVHFVGTLLDGKVFDESRKRRNGDPFKFRMGLGHVIKGLDQGVATMSKGERALFTIAPQLAYGPEGAGWKVPKNATLRFDVELLHVDELDPLTEEEEMDVEPEVDPFGRDDVGLGGEVAGKYSWERRGQEVLVIAPLADDVGPKDIEHEFTPLRVLVKVQGKDLLKGVPGCELQHEECFWDIDSDSAGRKCLFIHLQKKDALRARWPSELFMDE